MSGVQQKQVARGEAGMRLDRWFKTHFPQITHGRLEKLLRTGQVRIDGARAKAADRLEQGQVIRIPPLGEAAAVEKAPPRARTVSAADAKFVRALVIHKDAEVLVLNKPAGLAVQGGTGTERHLDGLLDALAFDAPERPRLVHRLDKDTSGALLIARTSRAAAFFAKSFSGRTARKIYWALVMGVPDIEDGFIELPIGKQPGTGGEKMQVDMEEGSPARTRYRVIEQAGNRCAWVELQPFTGRTHQLRVHMAAIGHPIVGDGKYGGPDAFLTGAVSRKMHLHARRLIITEPKAGEGTGGKLDVTAELPPHFAASMEVLGFDPSLSDASPLREEVPEKTAEEKKQAARRHFKQARKETRAPRRARGATKAKPKAKAKGKPKSKGR